MILVTGGTGTLGKRLVTELLEAGERVRVLTRDRARAPAGVSVVEGDLRDPVAIASAMRGCTKVVSAAHGFVGPGEVTPEAIDRDANLALIRAAKDAHVDRFVLVSVQGASADHPMSLARAKHVAEEELRASGLAYAIVRAAPFLETWIMVLNGLLAAKGHALVFGPGTNPVSFVSVRDVAALIAMALRDGALANECVDIGGPEDLGLLELAQKVVGTRGAVKHVPLTALRAMSFLARPFAPAFARRAAAGVAMNTRDMVCDRSVRTRFPSLPATTLEAILESCASLPSARGSPPAS